MFPSRPKSLREESENDLIREQEKFLQLKDAGKIDLSVKQIVKSKRLDNTQSIKNEPQQSHSAIGELPIVERVVSDFSNYSFPQKRRDAFPRVQRRCMNREKKVTHQGSSKSGDISSQNDDLLGGMTVEEIVAMKNEYLSKLDPQMVEFIKNRSKTKKNIEGKKSPISKRPSTSSIKTLEPKFEPELPLSSGKGDSQQYPIPLDVVAQEKWINMGIVEEDKLEWVRSISEPSRNSDSKNARFNLVGELVCEDQSVKAGLHHHGQEPDKPGYSLEEVYTFIRSTFDSQIITGLKILTHIMDKAHKGYYDLCFDANISKECLENTDILIWIRKCLDNPSESVIVQAIVCLHALVCNTQIDESCLDRLFPITMHFNNFLELQPNDQVKSVDEKEIRDEILIRDDVIKGLIRIDTLPRLRYLLENNIKNKDDPLILNRIFDLLIRISRHSFVSRKAIIDCPFLLELLITNFIPSSINFFKSSHYGNPSPKVLKLLRVFLADEKNVLSILQTYPHIWSALKACLTLDPDCLLDESSIAKKSHVLCIAIESLRIWCVLLQFHSITSAKEHFEQIHPVIFRQLQYCLTLKLDSSQYDLQYAATLTKCLVYVVRNDSILQNSCISMVESLLFQFVHEFVHLNVVPSFDATMLITTCIELVIVGNTNRSSLMANLLNPIVEKEGILKKLFLDLKKFSFMLQSKTYLNGCKRDAACLPSYGSVYFGGKQIKIAGIAQHSAVIFLMEALLAASDSALSYQVASNIIINEWLTSYLKDLIKEYEDFGSNIYKELEYTFIYQVCIASLKLPFVEQRHLFYNLALIIIFNLSDIKMRENLLNTIIFNPKLLEALTARNGQIENCESIASLAKETYFKYSKFDSQFWIFDPIIYSFKEKSSCEQDISSTLRFCRIILGTCSRKVIEKLISSDIVFSHFVTTFLLEKQIFRDNTVKNELTSLLKLFVEEKLTILAPQEKLPHATNILNLFDMVLNHFEAESFQDSLYINYLLIFLQSSSRLDFCKKLFSDHHISLRFFSLDLDSLIVPIERLLYPILTDYSLIEDFLRNLLSQNIPTSSILYLMAVHHVHFSIFANQVSDSSSEHIYRCRLSVEKSQNTTLKDHLINFKIDSLCKSCPWAKKWRRI